MSAGLANSTIDRFRLRYHGGNHLRFLRLTADGQSFNVTAEITKGFFLMRLGEAEPDGLDAKLTVDLAFTSGVVDDDLLASSYVDYFNPDTDEMKRYRIRAEVPPEVDEWRFVMGLFASFSDQRPII